jgi:hypothetical protein
MSTANRYDGRSASCTAGATSPTNYLLHADVVDAGPAGGNLDGPQQGCVVDVARATFQDQPQRPLQLISETEDRQE